MAGVAIVIESLGGGGAQHVAATLANTWAAGGFDVTVITFQGVESDVFRLGPHVRRTVVGGRADSAGAAAAIVANLRRIRTLRAALKGSAAQTIVAFIGSTNILTILASSGLGLRVIVSERNDPARQSLGKVWDFLRRLLYRRAELVVANSRAAIGVMAAYVPPSKLRWLPNPLRAASGQEGERIVSQPFFLSVGRLDRQKGHDILLTAFATVAGRLSRWRLVVLGGGPLRTDLENLASKLAISERVRFAGYVADPFPCYRQAAALVHPARFEGMPNVVLEAMSVGTPVVVTDAQAGLEGIVRHGETGLVVPVGSSEALGNAMLRLAAEADWRDRLGEAGQEAVAVFRADRAIAAWTELLM